MLPDKNRATRSWYISNGVLGFDLSALPRCAATAKTTGKKCQRRAKKGWDFCGIHAGLYTPGRKKGKMNRLKHGLYTETAIKERREVKDAIRVVEKTIKRIEDGVSNRKPDNRVF